MPVYRLFCCQGRSFLENPEAQGEAGSALPPRPPVRIDYRGYLSEGSLVDIEVEYELTAVCLEIYNLLWKM